MNQAFTYRNTALTAQERHILSAFRRLDRVYGGYLDPATPQPLRRTRSRVESAEASADLAWLGWAAGIVDGEGCVHLARPCGRARRWDLQVIVNNTDRGMLERLRALFGGSIGTPARQSERHKQQYRWKVAGDGAVEMLKRIRPWLVTKVGQADVAIAAGRSRNEATLEGAKAELHRLNRKGPA